MTQDTLPRPAAAPAATASGAWRAVQLALAAILGVVTIGMAGFASMPAMHNAAHDYRHSMGFPCH